MINIFLDCLIYNFTPYKSFFFLSNINNNILDPQNITFIPEILTFSMSTKNEL